MYLAIIMKRKVNFSVDNAKFKYQGFRLNRQDGVIQHEITKKQYIDYQICITENYLSSGLAENLNKANDSITDNLKSENLIAKAQGSWL